MPISDASKTFDNLHQFQNDFRWKFAGSELPRTCLLLLSTACKLPRMPHGQKIWMLCQTSSSLNLNLLVLQRHILIHNLHFLLIQQGLEASRHLQEDEDVAVPCPANPMQLLGLEPAVQKNDLHQVLPNHSAMSAHCKTRNGMTGHSSYHDGLKTVSLLTDVPPLPVLLANLKGRRGRGSTTEHLKLQH